VALLFLAVAAALLVSQRRAIARWLLLGEIHRAGIEKASLEVEAVSVEGLSLTDLRLGAPPALEIARIDARYSPAGLWKGHLDELSIWGLRLWASLGDDGLSLGALDPLLEGDSAGAGGLPARKIAIADARADLEAPGGAVTLPFELGIDDLGDGRLEGEASFEVRHRLAKASGHASIVGTPDDFEGTLRILGSPLEIPDLRVDSVLRADASFWFRGGGFEARAELHPVPVLITGDLLRAEGETPEIRLQLRRPAEDAAFGLGLETHGGRLDLADYELSVAKIDASARLEEGSGEGSLRIGELRDLQSPARVEPLELRGRFEIRDSSIGYHLKLANPGESLVLEAKGSADPVAPSALAELRLHPLVFDPAGLQPAALFPFLEGRIEGAQGSVEAVGTASWDGVRSTAEIDLALREIGFAAEAAEVSGVNGRIEIGGPFPPVTPPGQLISIALIDTGLELTDGLIEFQLRPDGLLELQEADWQWAGGVVRTAGLLDPTADSQETVLEVEGVELAGLLELVDLEGLEGTGRLEGEIPIFRDGETVEIRNAELRGGPEGGKIRYRPASGVEAALAGQGYGIDQLLGALDDFQYDALQLTVDGDTRGEVGLAVHLGGSNPNYQGGRRVEFNLNVEARLGDLLRAGLAAYRVPEVIEKRLEQFQAPEVK
jgi:hypothetical protein